MDYLYDEDLSEADEDFEARVLKELEEFSDDGDSVMN